MQSKIPAKVLLSITTDFQQESVITHLDSMMRMEPLQKRNEIENRGKSQIVHFYLVIRNRRRPPQMLEISLETLLHNYIQEYST